MQCIYHLCYGTLRMTLAEDGFVTMYVADGLVKRLEELEKTAELYKGMFYNLLFNEPIYDSV